MTEITISCRRSHPCSGDAGFVNVRVVLVLTKNKPKHAHFILFVFFVIIFQQIVKCITFTATNGIFSLC